MIIIFMNKQRHLPKICKADSEKPASKAYVLILVFVNLLSKESEAEMGTEQKALGSPFSGIMSLLGQLFILMILIWTRVISLKSVVCAWCST